MRKLRLSDAVFASAIELVIESVLLEQLATTLLQTFLTPVLCPKTDSFNLIGSPRSGCIYLVEIFPTRRSKRGGQLRNTLFLSLISRCQKAIAETHFTTSSTFRLTLISMDKIRPAPVVIIAVNPPYS